MMDLRKERTVNSVVRPIGSVWNNRTEIRMTDNWAAGAARSSDERFGDDCLLGLADFSHVNVLFIFDQLSERPDCGHDLHAAVRIRQRSGVFADRGPRDPTASL